MKKATLLIGSLLLLTSLHIFAQVKRPSRNQNTALVDNTTTTASQADGTPVILLGTIATSVSSREKILAYPRLLPQVLGCDVKGFSFTITAGDKTWSSEPVKGAVLTEDIKDKIKEMDAPKMKITIDNIRIAYNGTEMTARPIEIEYSH